MRGGKREGAGRPKKERGSKVLTISISAATAEIMADHAMFAGCSLAKLARESIMYGEQMAYKALLSEKKIDNNID